MQSIKSRMIRIVIGAIIMVVGAFYHSWWGAVGLVPFVVGVSGFCPACYFLNRCKLPQN
ncbi:DUF2892 domain-containing protein [Campylobacter sp. JMF_01 NE2]|uniref:YgaP family membrane protein n=1 Tax=unclassified Campylobacter TaxID=2593542 RepID=UPI001B521C48|nr:MULTISPECIES: DUF2892 domain-containing protein [unclassified Campylobacter]MBP3225033.1 DUF2892 domain-containing protein [Campylobacter sp.]MDA3047649.1 DUF2892 domain-containing protein [Campylobacter sp. JMF_08 NE1]MDA3049118.1 DUF2892 domain-containing protein [Campylobacter sp. JMF_15 NE4]MDA3051457.1 DUF2892 domain-containing protein [Campylobacter sp. JMF_02 ED1]MDA3052712.1 DUF2892 domain-containing protein [Campylobacter sp. JMF_03 NE3]